MGLRSSWQIRDAYKWDESIGLIAHGPRGIGKSSFSVHTAAEALVPFMDEPDYEAVKRWVIFTPQQFCQKILEVQNKRMVLVWDDAGYWINRLFWYEQFVREALRYMTIARTQFASIIFSTPSLRMLPSKILELPDVYRVKITKYEGGDKNQPNQRLRVADVKSVWYSDDLKRHGVKNEWSDVFSAFMPDPFFEWYEPKRKEYLGEAQRLIQAALQKTPSKKMQELIEEQIGKTVPSQEDLKELDELSKQVK